MAMRKEMTTSSTSPQFHELSLQPRLLVLKAEQAHAVLEEAEPILLQHGRVATNKLVEHGIVRLLVSQGHQEGSNYLRGRGGPGGSCMHMGI